MNGTAIIDNRVSNQPQERKIDLNKALILFFKHKVPEADIARHFQTTASAVNQALKPFKELIYPSDTLEALRNNEIDILDSAKFKMVQEMLNKKRLKKATTGNIAYTYDKLATHSRLEKGLSTSNVSYHDITGKLETIDAQIEELEGQEVGESTSNEADNTHANVTSLPPTKPNRDHGE